METALKYLADDFLNIGIVDGAYLLIQLNKNGSRLHCHDFYEIILVIKGKAVHYINGQKQLLGAGSCVIIRPADNHCFDIYENFECMLLIISFTALTVKILADYLGNGFDMVKLTDNANPAMAMISEYDINYLLFLFNKLNSIPRTHDALIKTNLRILIIYIIIHYFPPSIMTSHSDIPSWLHTLCLEIAKKENFTEGIQVLKKLSKKTSFYLCHTFKQYFNVTPTGYINNLKLSFAANLLMNSNLDIISIALDSGFNSISHFNHLFKKKFGMSPGRYRILHKKEQPL